MGEKATEKRVSVAGEIGARTEEWRTLSYILGDAPADLVCAWADLCPDPAEAVEGALSVARLALAGTEMERLNEHMLSAGSAAYLRLLTEQT